MNPPNIIFVLGAYLLGSIHFGLIAGYINHVDIRKWGSGNVGTTNVFRLLGKKWGAIVFVLDTLKGWLPVFLSLRLTDSTTLAVVVAGAAILGHTFSAFLRLKGGKGVATGLGTVIALMPTIAAIAFGVFALILLIRQTVSLASLSAVSFLLLVSILTNQPAPYIVFISLGMALIFYAHRSNIRRLLNGTENRIQIWKRKGG